MDKKKYTAIILSAGTGSRMKSNMPKQYMELLGQPEIYYSIKAFEDSPVDEIVISVSYTHLDVYKRQTASKECKMDVTTNNTKSKVNIRLLVGTGMLSGLAFVLQYLEFPIPIIDVYKRQAMTSFWIAFAAVVITLIIDTGQVLVFL